MTNREAIKMLKTILRTVCLGNRYFNEAIDMAVSALENQERSNAQNVNSTHMSRPNALESLNILESAKDENGCVPMSLVRLAFRNVLEQDRWISVTERFPEIHKDVLVTDRE